MRTELSTIEQFDAHIAAGRSLAEVAVKDLDLRARADALEAADLRGTVFLGCMLPPDWAGRAHQRGALVFPTAPNLPFNPYRISLYTPDELYQGFDPAIDDSFEQIPDSRINAWYQQTDPSDVLAALFQRLHDLAISDALLDAIAGQRVVGIMGGHNILRTDPHYEQVAMMAAGLAEAGFVVASGGGPGAMEAANLGPWLAGQPPEVVGAVLDDLRAAPDPKDRSAWLTAGFAARDRLLRTDRCRGSGALPASLGVPTWFYGHEPPNLFGRFSAKYFENSVREAGLISIANGGMVFTPGDAGTVQEIFQDATLNRYGLAGPPRPMVFLGADFWHDLPAFALLQRLAAGHAYAELLYLTDDPAEVVTILRSSPSSA